ncbi:MAG: elongation factor Ts [Bacteroidetes bacterium]|nr:elongation factor Ts [Bacteroidota bacterium]
MEITSEVIKRLRDKTGAGMMDCKRALEASKGDIEGAIEFLRKKGAAVGQKRSDRSAKEGIIVTRVSPDATCGVAVEVNCETDFVGRSDDFVAFAGIVADAVLRERPANVEALSHLKSPSGKTVGELLNDLLAKVGEKLEIRRFQIVQSPNGIISSYTHLGSKIGVLVEFAGIEGSGPSAVIGRDVAMQVAAMSPSVISRDQVEKTTIEHELEIYRTQAKNEGKKEQVIERIATGRLEKFYQEVCLLEQTFIKDPGKTIKDVLQDAEKLTGKPVSIRSFVRFHLGEEAK